MSRDYAEKEKAFLESLKADTGRDLGEWMAAVSSQGFTQRNDIIDWFRHQGFIFSRASWLERIHNNGGRPIYLREQPPDMEAAKAMRDPQGAGAGKPALRIVVSNPDVPERPTAGEEQRRRAGTEDAASRPTLVTGRAAQANAPPAGGCSATLASGVASARTGAGQPVTPIGAAGRGGAGGHGPLLATTACAPDELEAALLRAKAFAPLARHVLGQIQVSIRDVSFNASKSQIALMAPMPFGALVVSGKGLRLCLNLGDVAFDDRVLKARLPAGLGRVPSSFSHMVVLDDARQVDDALLLLVRKAAENVN